MKYYAEKATRLTIISLLGLCSNTAIAATAALDIDRLPDPTIPTNTSASSNTVANNSSREIKLQSIIHSGQRHSAVINGQIMNLGSYIDGDRIVSIKHDTVVINHKGQPHTLHITPSAGVTQRDNQP